MDGRRSRTRGGPLKGLRWFCQLGSQPPTRGPFKGTVTPLEIPSAGSPLTFPALGFQLFYCLYNVHSLIKLSLLICKTQYLSDLSHMRTQAQTEAAHSHILVFTSTFCGDVLFWSTKRPYYKGARCIMHCTVFPSQELGPVLSQMREVVG